MRDKPTPRQLEILGQLSIGSPIARIAADLAMSESTVKAHIQRAMDRLGTHTRTHAVSVCIRKGWI